MYFKISVIHHHHHLPRAVRKHLFINIMQAICKMTHTTPTNSPTYDPATIPWRTSKGDEHTSNPTAPHIAKMASQIHQQNTRHNVPPTPTPLTMPHPTPLIRPVPTVAPTPPPSQPDENAAPRRSPRIALMARRLYSNAALSTLNIQTYAPLPTLHAIRWLCEHFCAPVIHPVTGKSITKYKTLVNNPITAATWA